MQECPLCHRCFDDGEDACPEHGPGLVEIFAGSPLLDGRYRLTRRIAAGGMGEIYVAEDEKLRRRVAIKGIRNPGVEPTAAEETRSRLLREARLLSQLNHPGICQIHEFFEADGRDYMVLELIVGHHLGQAIERGLLSERRRMKVAIRVAEVLVAAHGAGVVHRDLKPANVMLPDGAPDTVKVLDFGIARAVGAADAARVSRELAAEPDDVTMTWHGGHGAADTETTKDAFHSLAAGTPHYMSPEQLFGRPPNAASDMFSFGLLLQELFTGRPAYDRSLSLVDLVQKVATARTQPVTGLAPGLTELIEQLQSKLPEARPSAAETLDRLRRIREAPRRLLRRILVTAALVVLSVFGAVMTWQAVRIREVAERAERAAALAQSRFLTSQSRAERATDLDRALLLAVEARRRADTVEAREALLEALNTSPGLERVLHRHHQLATVVAWRPDGRMLASASRDVVLWDVETWQAVRRFDAGSLLRSLAWNATGERFATGDHVGHVAVWTLDAERVWSVQAHEHPVSGLSWSGDGSLVVSSSSDGVRAWDATRGTAVDDAEHTLVDPATADRDTDAIRTVDRFIEVRDPASDPVRRLEGHADEVVDAAASPSGRWLASAGVDTKVIVWDLRPGIRTGVPHRAHEGPVRDLGWSPDGRQLASVGGDGVVLLRDPVAGTSEQLSAYTQGLLALAWDAAGERIATGANDGRIHLWNAGRRSLDGPPLDGHTKAVRSLAWSPDGLFIASAGEDHLLRFWSVRRHALLHPPLEGHQVTVLGVAFSPDGRRLYSSDASRSTLVWDVGSGAQIGRIEGAKGYSVLSPDGRTLFTGDGDRVLQRWDLDSVDEGRPTPRLLAGHEGFIWALALSPDASFLASASDDRSIGIWNLPDATLFARLRGQRFYSVAVSKDGILAAGDSEGNVHLWDLGGGPGAWQERACRRAGRDFTADEWRRLMGEDVPYRATCGFGTAPPPVTPADGG